MTVLVTGANGFVGTAVVRRLIEIRRPVKPCIRSVHAINEIRNQSCTTVSDISNVTDWSNALRGVTEVIHSAARVHVMNETVSDPLAEFRKINVEGTLNLARQAASAGVRRFVFISSIKVNGERTELGRPYTEDDVPAPIDPYGISKLEAEQGLLLLAGETGMEVSIIRPVLIYGPGVRANFFRMMKWLRQGIPLPLGAIHNKRSLVALDNLVDLLITCLDHPAAANQVFLVSDGEDISTTDLLRRMGKAMGKHAHLLPIPVSFLNMIASLFCKRDIAQRLCESLQVDISKTRLLLGWKPPISMDQGLQQAAEGMNK